jgi:hypothetical protein
VVWFKRTVPAPKSAVETTERSLAAVIADGWDEFEKWDGWNTREKLVLKFIFAANAQETHDRHKRNAVARWAKRENPSLFLCLFVGLLFSRVRIGYYAKFRGKLQTIFW